MGKVFAKGVKSARLKHRKLYEGEELASDLVKSMHVDHFISIYGCQPHGRRCQKTIEARRLSSEPT